MFDMSRLRTYPLKVRANRSDLSGFVDVAALRAAPVHAPRTPWFRNGLPGGGADQSAGFEELARYVVECHRAGRPVVVICGAHRVKNGQIPIVIDLINRGVVSLFSTSVAGAHGGIAPAAPDSPSASPTRRTGRTRTSSRSGLATRDGQVVVRPAGLEPATCGLGILFFWIFEGRRPHATSN
ncbi:MAG: hypothetical protein AMK73_00260 [Planctomycetes bacterium SM23_32]|nr:MAG: hypothetical protein AMK73_00260 [Planctomycetes bacterium SM23_32]